MALIPVEDARAYVLERCATLAPVALGLDDALGLVTASALTASEAVPPFANTAMDGYALRASDTEGASEAEPVILAVVGSVAAGQAPGIELGPGQAIRIMTGAPMPEGADAVVMVELTRAEGDRVHVRSTARRGDHVRGVGDDIGAGDEVIPAGTVLTPAHLGVAASVGAIEMTVHRRLRVGVLSTGDELVDGDAPLRHGQIRDSNRRTLLGLVRQSGCEAIDLGIARDNEEEIAAALGSAAAGCDAVLTSGGVSVGDFDYVKAVLDRLSGGDMRWMRVAVRPAKPFAFGRLGPTPVFGLPGNPVSSTVSFEIFARPALRQMMGFQGDARFRPVLAALAGESFRSSSDGRLSLVRVSASMGPDGRVRVRSTGSQGSHVLSAMARANALALLPDGSGAQPGDQLDIWLLGDLLTASA